MQQDEKEKKNGNAIAEMWNEDIPLIQCCAVIPTIELFAGSRIKRN